MLSHPAEPQSLNTGYAWSSLETENPTDACPDISQRLTQASYSILACNFQRKCPTSYPESSYPDNPNQPQLLLCLIPPDTPNLSPPLQLTLILSFTQQASP